MQRDAPYVLREPDAAASDDLPKDLTPLLLAADRDRRADACACYATQLGFQFGGPGQLRAALAGFDEVVLADPGAAAMLQA